MMDYGEEALIDKWPAYLAKRYAARGHRVPGRKPRRKLGISARYVVGRTACTKAGRPAILSTAAELSATLAELAPEGLE